jgi:phage virion morphogenesis protein
LTVAGAEISLSVECSKLLRDLGEARKRARDMMPAFQQIGEHMQDSILQNFAAGGRPDPWAPLKPRTLIGRAGGARKAYKKRGGLTAKAQRTIAGHKILIQSGALRGSIHYVASSDNVLIGSALVYAATHQYGRTRGRGTPIPARPFLVVQPEDDREISRILTAYLTSPLR